MKIAILQIRTRIGAFDENIRHILSFYRKAASLKCDLAICPELSLCGYPPKDLLERREFIACHNKAFQDLISEVGDTALLIGHLEENRSGKGRPLFNAASIVQNREVIHTAYKRLIPTYDIFDETRYFEQGKLSSVVRFKGVGLGITICEDLWTEEAICKDCRYSEDPVKDLVEQGAQLLINISASPFNIGKEGVRLELIRSIACKYRVSIVYVNSIGAHDCLIFDGGSIAVGRGGEVLMTPSQFKECLYPLSIEAGGGVGHVLSCSGQPPFSGQLLSPPEEALNALVLSLKDYVDYCGFKGVVVGLSGGIDSSVVASIAVLALGKERVMGVLMPSQFTSQESIDDALNLCKNLGINYEIIPIQEIFDVMRAELLPVFKDRPWDVTEENMQARIRGNILMSISNKTGYMVLSTGNKSELAVGYCTLYGDLSGGFSLIADCPKTLVYDIAGEINKEREIIPQNVFIKPPTAELRAGQRDEDDLPSYPVLDRILSAFIEQGRTKEEIVRDTGISSCIVEQVIGMILKNEYKRKQAPIAPRITTKALGCGRRWPVCHRFSDF